MPDTVKSYLQRNLKKVMGRLGSVALLNEVAESNLAAALATKINGKAEGTALTALDGKVTTLIGSDTDKSVRTIANEELATQLIPETAKESLDTLQEIAAWIQSHPDEAAAINAKLTLGTHEVEGQQVQYANVRDYVEAVVAGFISLTALSGAATGSGNVVTGFAYDNSTGAFTATKGDTAVMVGDLVDLTDAEVDAIFARETPAAGE